MRTHPRLPLATLIIIAAASAAWTDFTALDAQPTITTVMNGLANPRGLAFAPDGALYVAEAGRGGGGPCTVPGALCYGPTGGVSRLSKGLQRRIVDGLPSLANPVSGARAIGAHDIAMLGVGSAVVTIGLEQDPAIRDLPEFPEFEGFGRLVHVTPGGQWRFVADVSAYEAQFNPDGRLREDGTPHHDSNPFGLLALPGKHLVADAGANALLSVDAAGRVSLLAVFHSRGTIPPRPSCAPPLPVGLDPITDAVPTAVVKGPDGAYYVSELTGVPSVDRTANIHRVVPGDVPRLFLIGNDPCVDGFSACITGFKTIIDMDFDVDGNLYVLQFATGPIQQPAASGVLIRVTPDKTQPNVCAQYQAGLRTTVLSGLAGPTSVVVGPDDALYVTNRGNSAINGEVLRISPQ